MKGHFCGNLMAITGRNRCPLALKVDIGYTSAAYSISLADNPLPL